MSLEHAAWCAMFSGLLCNCPVETAMRAQIIREADDARQRLLREGAPTTGLSPNLTERVEQLESEVAELKALASRHASTNAARES